MRCEGVLGLLSPLPLISFYPIYDDAESLLLGEFAVLDLLSIIVHHSLLVLLSMELNHIHEPPYEVLG